MSRFSASCLALVAVVPALLAAEAPLASAESILRHTRTLASDEFEGRAPGTAGEEKTVAYLVSEFKRLGLQPGNPDGTYVQNVPAVGITSKSALRLSAGGRTLEPQVGIDFIALSRHRIPHVTFSSDVVFVGYGITAPEFGWDDFKGVDVRGKTVLMLVNDPPITKPDGALDDAIFGGRAMTYYGRWTYKFESATAHGAAAVLVIHETGPAGYPFAVIAAGSGREQFDVGSEAASRERVAAEGWITVDLARELFAAAGQDFAALKAAAARRDFQPVSLAAKAEFTIENTLRPVNSRNVIALLPGADPQRRDEYVIYSAHWDAYGRNPALQGDQILNGAADNAIAVAMMLEIAEAATKLPPAERPQRSLLFLSPTYEEKGTLGSAYYARNPLYPLTKTLGNINLEPLDCNPGYGPTRDLEVVGRNASTLDDYANELAPASGFALRPDTEPEKGYYYRSDHFEFAKVGVPAFFVRSGTDAVDEPAGTGARRRHDYLVNDYHKISDEVRPDWTCRGAAQMARFLLALGLRTANATAWPAWKPGTEFQAIRDAQLTTPRP